MEGASLTDVLQATLKLSKKFGRDPTPEEVGKRLEKMKKKGKKEALPKPKSNSESDGEATESPKKKEKKEKKKETKKSKKKSKKEKKRKNADTDTDDEATTTSTTTRSVADDKQEVKKRRKDGSGLPPHKLVLAPMVGGSELAFRMLCRKSVYASSKYQANRVLFSFCFLLSPSFFFLHPSFLSVVHVFEGNTCSIEKKLFSKLHVGFSRFCGFAEYFSLGVGSSSKLLHTSRAAPPARDFKTFFYFFFLLSFFFFQ